MSETGARTDKGFQRTVLGGLGLAIIVIFGIVLFILETTAITTAAFLLLTAMVLTILALLVDL